MDTKTTVITREQLDCQLSFCNEIKAFWRGQGITPKAYVETYGCQQNEADSEQIRGMLAECGYAITDTTRFFFFNKELVLTSGEGSFFHTFRMGLNQWGVTTYYHPTFLYESVWNIVGFALANVIYKHKRFHGQIALFYFTWYGFGRMFIEGFRTDSLYVPGTNIRISQLVGLLCFIGCGAALLVLTILTRKREPLLVLENAAYEAAKKLEAELAESTENAAEPQKTELQKLTDSLTKLWQKVKTLFGKQEEQQEEPKEEPQEAQPKEAAEEPTPEEEKEDGNEN